MAAVALIQGASRGLGLEFCKQILLNKSPACVIATCRNPENAVELLNLAAQHPGKVTVLKLDVNTEDDIRSAAEKVKQSFGALDLIINSSAMLHPSGKGETSLRDVSAQVRVSRQAAHRISILMHAVTIIIHVALSIRLFVTGSHFYFDDKYSGTAGDGQILRPTFTERGRTIWTAASRKSQAPQRNHSQHDGQSRIHR